MRMTTLPLVTGGSMLKFAQLAARRKNEIRNGAIRTSRTRTVNSVPAPIGFAWLDSPSCWR
jgi:hypothetical protein